MNSVQKTNYEKKVKELVISFHNFGCNQTC